MKWTLSAIDDLPEEILYEILCRLGVKPLFRCKCVSKPWNSVISDPNFRQFYLQRPLKSSSSPCLLSAMLYPTVNFDRGLLEDFRDLSVHDIDDDAPPTLYVTSFDRPYFTYRIDASSNGLILSSLAAKLQRYTDRDEQEEYALYWELDFCVSNPLTSHSAKLPTYCVDDSYEPWGYGLATRAPQPQAETQDYVAFKVVFINILKQPPRTDDSFNIVLIDIFSSDTRGWTHKEGMSFPDARSYDARPRAFSYKGILHFFDWNTSTVVTYDPYDSPDQFGSIKFPSGSGGKKLMNSGLDVIRLGYEDMLEFGEIEDCGNDVWRLCVWRLVDYDKREWRLEKCCRISPLWKQSLLSDCKLLVAPHPWNTDFFCWFLSNGNQLITLHDLASAEKLSADPFAVKGESISMAYKIASGLVVPIALNPWSSPFHGEAGRNSSSKPRYRKIIPAWFRSFTK